MSNYIERYWRDATPADAIKEPPMVARFRDRETTNWGMPRKLSGWDREGDLRWSSGTCFWKYCQVYDAPDPGQGWRLIDIDKDVKQEGDEFWSLDGVWKRAASPGFLSNHTYRRRITPAITYVAFTWEDREQLRGKKVLAKEPHRQVEFTCDEFQLNDDGSFFVDEFYSVWLCKNAVFVDTGKPVGKEVTQ